MNESELEELKRAVEECQGTVAELKAENELLRADLDRCLKELRIEKPAES